MSKDAGIESRTIESFRYAVEQKDLTLDQNDVIVMDEAGMTDSVSMMAVLKVIQEARAKLVLIGDHAQLQPVGPGASFRALLERLGFAEIQTVYRQKEPWQRDATVHLSAGHVAEALNSYDTHGCVHFENTSKDAMSLLVNDWGHHSTELSRSLVIAHRNEDVNHLNALLRQKRVSRAEIAQGYTATAKRGKIKLASGDRILFLKNKRRLGVSNGRFASIKAVNFTESGEVIDFTVILDGENKEVCINPKKYWDFDYGYAATVYKVQGMTVDHAFVYAGGSSWNRHLTYVALSRHRETCHLYASKETHQNRQLLQRNLGRLGIKDSLLDFPLAFLQRRGIDTTSLLKLLPEHLSQRLKAFKEKLADQIEEFRYPKAYALRRLAAAQEAIEAQKITLRREDARWVASYVDLNRDVGMAWQALNVRLDAMGLDGMNYESQVFELISGTKEYTHFQSTLLARNKAAHHLMQAPIRYEKAIEIYDIDLNKLTKQSLQHICYERVSRYANFCNKGMVIHRDRLAAEILPTIKAHYAYLKNFQLETLHLKRHALSHTKRQLFKTLTGDERASFRVVEAYQESVAQVGTWWTDQIKSVKEPLKHFVLLRLETLSHKRDRLAYEILKDREHYDKALDFYQIGLATPQYGEKPTEQALHQAQARWYRLQEHAARHTLRTRVKAYHQALFLGDVEARMSLAFEIMQGTSAHHAAIVGLGVNTQEVWRAIRRDAKLHERHDYYCRLDLIERLGFNTVASYVEAKRSHAQAWRELFESKKAANLDEKTFYSTLTSYAKRYTLKRDRYAALILEDVLLHQAGLDYFKLNSEELHKEAYKHQCHVDVEHYLQGTILLRAQYALKIIADPKNYHALIIENKLNWRDIYRDARIAERRERFAHLSHEEKALYRLADRYREVNRKAGKLFSRLKLNNTSKSLEGAQRINHAFAKRDYLAWRLVNAASFDPQFLDEFATAQGLNANKLREQQAKHAERLSVIERYYSSYRDVVLTTREIHKVLSQSKAVSLSTLQKAVAAIETASGFQKFYKLETSKSFDYALQGYSLSKEELMGQMKGLVSLKEHLRSLSNLNPLDKRRVDQPSPKAIPSLWRR